MSCLHEHWANCYDREKSICEVHICCDCGEWLSLGPSNDTPEVLVEIRAAELAASAEDGRFDSFTICEADGWMGYDNPDFDPTCAPEEVGWLAWHIWMHAGQS